MRFNLLLLFLLLVFSFSAVVFNKSKSATEVNAVSELSTDLTTYMEQYEELINEIKQELRKADIGFVLDYAILPNENIEILIKLPTEKIKRSAKKEITQLVNGVIKENNAVTDRFRLQISSYHKIPKRNTHFSARLSYNDLMGYIMQELENRDYSTFSLEYKVAPEKVELNISLPVDYDTNGNSRVEQIATDIIEQHHYDKDDFQINITNEIHTASSARNAEAQEIIKRIQETNFTTKLEEELKRNGYSPNGLMSFQIYSKDKQYIMLYFENMDPQDEGMNRDIQKIVDNVSRDNGLGLFKIDIQGI